MEKTIYRLAFHIPAYRLSHSIKELNKIFSGISEIQFKIEKSMYKDKIFFAFGSYNKESINKVIKILKLYKYYNNNSNNIESFTSELDIKYFLNQRG